MVGGPTGDNDAAVHVATFLVWTSGVGAVTWFICWRFLRSKRGTSDDYFAGGRCLKWYVVAGSLMLTNLSTEQLVGLNGTIFKDGCLAGIFWEAGAAIAMVVTATVFLPRYMSLGLTTTSAFLGERYDLMTRTLVSVVFLVYYTVVLCPLVLYTGALAIRKIFELEVVPLWVISLVIGLLGACYALFGGLKAVAVSDCLNGVGLLVVGLWVPVAALQRLGGISALFQEPSYLVPLVSHSQVYDNGTHERSWVVPTLPWHVTITGLTLTNLYYWSTNQVIVQRVLAAESLAQGQKGVLFAASMKVVGFTFLCLPGTVGLLMVKNGVHIDGVPFTVAKSDEVYPELVKAVMPNWSLGIFAAVLIGSVLSTFNSALNSASTIFGLEIYKIFINSQASEQKVVRVATVFGAGLTLASFFIAPQLSRVDSIFSFLQQANTVVSLPIITIFFVGIAASLPDAFAAKTGFAVGALACGLGQLATEEIHYLHIYFLAFLLAASAMAVAAWFRPLRRCFRLAERPSRYAPPQGFAKVHMAPWRPLYYIVASILAVIALLVVALQVGRAWLFYCFWAVWLLSMLTLMCLPSRPPAEEGDCQPKEPGVAAVGEDGAAEACGEDDSGSETACPQDAC